MSGLVSYAMCKEVVERDARIEHVERPGWWKLWLDGRRYTAETRAEVISAAAEHLQRQLEKTVE